MSPYLLRSLVGATTVLALDSFLAAWVDNATHGKKQGGAVVSAGPGKVGGGPGAPPAALEAREETLSRG